jgi:predicted Zn-dependent peptidase
VLSTRVARQPAATERVLSNGLRAVAVRKPGVPLVEVRLWVPFGGPAGPRGRAHAARGALLAETLFSGTSARSAVELAEELQAVGGALGAGVDPDRLSVGGSALASGLPVLLDVLADVLSDATFPSREVAGERDRLAHDLAVARTQPGVLAAAALGRRLYAAHPYLHELAGVEQVRAVTPAALRSLHASRLVPKGAVLVVVGDLQPARALDVAESALRRWTGGAASARDVPPLPPIVPGPLELADRAGAVQTNIRLAGPAVGRLDPAYPALQLAHTIFGGYFSSRLVANVREVRGYSYGPRSGLDHTRAGSLVTVTVDVATAVTAPALLETVYELGRMATGPVTADELDAARRYATGALALSTATQAGLASTLSALLPTGLGLDWLREHPRRLAAVTVDEVREAAARFLAPARLVSVLLGDASVVTESVSSLVPVEATTTEGL